ncbi:MAG TPA: endonuclease MutS2 [Candidatus Obscuribacterales bacterium]
MDIEARTRRSLEWERLKGYLAAECSCAASRELALQAQPCRSRERAQILLDETAEAFAMLSSGFGLSQDGLPELGEVLSRLRTGSQMSATELVGIRRMLQMTRRARQQLAQLSTNDFPRLTLLPAGLHAQEDLVAAIDDVFDEDGNIREDASPLLKSLRREVARLSNQTREELQRIINSSAASKALQEPLFTQRNGRYVLPVQASMRGAIQGIVHDSSASGLTVYVEPLSVVELTNKVRLKESEIEREIDRLLSALSALAQQRHEQLEVSYAALVEIDAIAARARLARKYNGVKPELAEDGRLNLKQARHPLLVLQNPQAASSVVANDIMLGGDVHTMIITGPNTGGKTVYLKTAGLLSMMAGIGLLLPVSAGSKAVVFQAVFADIGDEQSIEQNLSTFSSHLTNIIEIVNRSREGTLVLLDEIGAGTDPREGAVLARVILEHLNAAGALTISTTHYGEMKSLAYTTPGFLNGSFEFDDVHLSPTYHLRIGVPGSSKAVTIASRLGLAQPLIEAANAILSSGETDIQQMIDELERRLTALHQAEQEFAVRAQALEERETMSARTMSQIQHDKDKLKAEAAAQMRKEFDEAQTLVRSLIADLQKQPSIARAQKLQKDLEQLRADLGWMAPEEFREAQAQLQVGQNVKVLSLNQRGIIESLPEQGKAGADAQATVRAGAMKIKVPLSDLQPLQPAQGKPKAESAVQHTRLKSGAARHQTLSRVCAGSGQVDVFVRTSRNTIDIRGQRVEEALGNVESFVDSAFLEKLSPIMIIHGHGMGQLRAAVRKFLKESSYDASWRPGENYEGGDGVTVVQFK